MNRSHPRPYLALLLATIVSTVTPRIVACSIAQDTTCTLSGRVVDVEGNPIVESLNRNSAICN